MTAPDNRTDLANAERLIAAHGHELRYCDDFNRWYAWDGMRWARDDIGRVHRFAQQTARAIYAEAANPDLTEVEVKAIISHAKASENKGRRQAMVDEARWIDPIPVRPSQLDTDPWAFNVQNGTINLRTGNLNRHRPTDLITKLAPVDYDPDAEAPTWDKFLARIMADDDDVIAFLQRAVGYSLTGDISEECMFLPWGTGANGKSKFLGAIRALTGDYGQELPRDTLMGKPAGGIPNDLAALQGTRFATAIESSERRRLDEEIVKKLTGGKGDIVKARFLHGEFFEFQPIAKLWLATNHKPKISGTDEGIWRRVNLIPFEVVIPSEEQDHNLPDKLEAELPGILRWAINGCLEWQRRGLDPPEKIRNATKAYRAEEDALVDFLDEECVTNTDAWAHSAAIHARFQSYTGLTITRKELGDRLAEKGFVSCKKQGQRAWQGVGLIARTEHND